MKLADSGTRREFDTGAVRDIAKGKGRFDLMPLQNVADYFAYVGDDAMDTFFNHISEYRKENDINAIYNAIELVSDLKYGYNKECKMLLDLAIHFENGCNKYGDNNWQKGIPTECYIDSACRHFTKYMAGMEDEPHAIACIWNLICLAWTIENVERKYE